MSQEPNPALGLRIGIVVFLASMAFIAWMHYAKAETGLASYYSGGIAACRGMSVGPMTAARTLPCGARIRVTSVHGSVLLTITDRGPFVRGRILDVSRDAAGPLGLIGPGVLSVTVDRQ